MIARELCHTVRVRLCGLVVHPFRFLFLVMFLLEFSLSPLLIGELLRNSMEVEVSNNPELAKQICPQLISVPSSFLLKINIRNKMYLNIKACKSVTTIQHIIICKDIFDDNA